MTLSKAFSASMLIGAVLFNVSAASAGTSSDVYDARKGFSGARSLAANVLIIGMNPLTEDWSVNATTTSVAPPTLPTAVQAPSRTQIACVAGSADSSNAVNCVKNTIDGLVSSLDRSADIDTAKAAQQCLNIAITKAVDGAPDFTTDARIKSYEDQVMAFLGPVTPSSQACGVSGPSGGIFATTQSVAAVISAIQSWPTARQFSDVRDKLKAERDQLSKKGTHSPFGFSAPFSSAHAGEMTTYITTNLASIDAIEAKHDSFTNDRTSLLAYRDRILALRLKDFEYAFTSHCANLFGSGSETKLVLTVKPAKNPATPVTDDVTVVCQTRTFVSTGFAFSSIGNRSFTKIAPNPTTTAAPAAGATPYPSSIAENNTSSVRPISITFINTRLGGNASESGLYASFGFSVGSGSGTNSTPVDFAGGLSYSLGRTFIGTLGVNLGSETRLAPGYSSTLGQPGNLIPSSAEIPTITRTVLRYFFGISYGLGK